MIIYFFLVYNYYNIQKNYTSICKKAINQQAHKRIKNLTVQFIFELKERVFYYLTVQKLSSFH